MPRHSIRYYQSGDFDPERGDYSPPPDDIKNYQINVATSSNFLASAASFLGKRNPFSRHANDDTTVWLFHNTAFRDPDSGKWVAEFVAAFFKRDSGRDISLIVAAIAEKLGIARGSRERRTIADRLGLFAGYIESSKKIVVDFGGRGELELGPSGTNGISSEVISLPGGNVYEEGRFVRSRGLLSGRDHRKLEMKTEFAEPTGWAFISDIDDSIKITMTRSSTGTLQSTFVDDPTPIRGMPELYKLIDAELKPTWFYLSASPYNLQPFLQPFLSEYYPPGTLILRDMSWMNVESFILALRAGVKAYKVDRIDKIHSWLPKRRFICLGDSTATDPESYGTAYRKYPRWIGAIFIRIVTGVDERNERTLNAPERFEAAFEGVPRSVWQTFSEPEELHDFVAELRGEDPAPQKRKERRRRRRRSAKGEKVEGEERVDTES